MHRVYKAADATTKQRQPVVAMIWKRVGVVDAEDAGVLC